MPEAQAPAPPPGATGEAAAPPAFSRKWWVLVTVMVGTFMGPFDGSVVNIALPRLTDYFGVGVTTVEWVVVAYLLTVSTLLLTFGRLGDMIGLKKIYLTGFAVFVVGSAACALAWNIWALVGFRVLQALGAGMLFAVGPAIVTHAFPPAERGKALGFVGVSVAVGLALGPTLGGLLIGIFDWHLIFLVNLPVGLFALLLAWRVLRYDEPHEQRFDPLGSLTSFLALFPLLLALSRGEAWGWDSPLVLGLFALSAAGAITFVVTELRVEQPVLDLGLFRIRLFSAATISATASYVVTATVIFTIPFYLIDIRDFPVQVAGLLLTPVPLMTAIFGPLSGSWSDRIGSRFLSTTGLLISAVGVAALAGLERDTGTVGIVGRLLLIGVGMGLFQSPNTSAIMGSVPRHRLGIASGMVATARNVGMVLGVSLAAMVIAVREPVYLGRLLGELGRETAEKEAFLRAEHDAAWVAAGICLLGALVSLVRGQPAAGQMRR